MTIEEMMREDTERTVARIESLLPKLDAREYREWKSDMKDYYGSFTNWEALDFLKENYPDVYDDVAEEYAEQMELKLIDGEFLEGQTVTVEVIKTGKQYQRKVKYAKKYGDLYVTINNTDYPYSVVLE